MVWSAQPYGRAGLYWRGALLATQVSEAGTGVWQVPSRLETPTLAVEIQATGLGGSCYVVDTNVGSGWNLEARLLPETPLRGRVQVPSRSEAYSTHVRVAPHPKLMRGAGFFVPEDAALGGPPHGGRAIYEAHSTQDVALGGDGTFVVSGLRSGQDVWLSSLLGLNLGTVQRVAVLDTAPAVELDAPLRVQCTVTVTGDRRQGGYELRIGEQTVALESLASPERVVFGHVPAEEHTIVEMLLNGVRVSTMEIDLSSAGRHACSIAAPPR